MVKQAVDKTRGQEELAHAIAIAAADLSVFKESKLFPPNLEYV